MQRWKPFGNHSPKNIELRLQSQEIAKVPNPISVETVVVVVVRGYQIEGPSRQFIRVLRSSRYDLPPSDRQDLFEYQLNEQ